MRAIKILGVLLILSAVFAGGYLLRGVSGGPVPPPHERTVLYYVDPMHPAYRSDKPGVAPDCGMTLEPVYAPDAGDARPTADGNAPVLYYRDPTQPSYTAKGPGVNPATGNVLEPVFAAAGEQAPAGALRISPERQQLIGVKFETVRRGSAERAIRTVGKVSADETRIGHVHTRIEGWIDRVMVDFTGAVVRKDQPMLTVYSPEMLASQQELLLASRARDLMRDNPLASAATHGQSLFEAARRRLQLWDLSDDQIDQVLATGNPIRSITVHAPMAGFVTARNAFPNQKVTPDSDLYTIVDLSHVWIVADVFESDVQAIRLGDTARVSFSNNSAPPLTARINYIQPQVDPVTRTVQVRLDTANPGMRMKPDMFVNVEFAVQTAPQVTIPADAILDTGDRQTVFVDLGNGYLEPRQVTIGERFGDRVAVTGGLQDGERIVSSGTFLIDSESQLKAAASGMGAPPEHQHGSGGAPAATPPPPARELPKAPGTGAPHQEHGRD
ncbi:MAG: efflux RND transporter periplasmic adaptor subunit [Vicinamibacterales bacterium]